MTHETPKTDKAEEESIRAYENDRAAGWPPFPCDGYDLARAFEQENNRLREELESIVDFDCGHWAAGKYENEAIRLGYKALKQIASDALANVQSEPREGQTL